MLLLDDEFIEAYRNGMVIRCYDGVLRRIYPRIFTYSADYPEKWVYTHLHFYKLNFCSTEFFWRLSVTMDHPPVPGVMFRGPCLVALGLSRMSYHGFPMHAITYETRYVLRDTQYTSVVRLSRVWQSNKFWRNTLWCLHWWVRLFDWFTFSVELNHSKNAFAERLSPFGFDIFSSLVVDLMHEFELGILKSVLKHLIWILYTLDPELVTVLNERQVLLASI